MFFESLLFELFVGNLFEFRVKTSNEKASLLIVHSISLVDQFMDQLSSELGVFILLLGLPLLFPDLRFQLL